MAWNLKRIFLPRTIFSILIILGFIYQFYDLTQDYLHYNHLIKFDMKKVNMIIPSITICGKISNDMKKHPVHWMPRWKQLNQKIKGEGELLITDRIILCSWIQGNWDSQGNYDCTEISNTTYIRFKPGSF